jgi:serine/threonine protein kinase
MPRQNIFKDVYRMPTPPYKTMLSLEGYKNWGLIGQGTFARVYLMQSQTDGLLYAVKEITTYNTKEIEFVYREIMSLKKLTSCSRSPTLLKTLKKGPTYYLITEYIPGLRLDLWVQQIRSGKLKCSPQSLVGVLNQLAQTVAYLQQCNLLHRDLKPQNIIIHPHTYHVTLLDFGLACETHVILQDRIRAGSKAYSPPEMFDPTFIFTKRYPFFSIDIYSLGLIFYLVAGGKALSKKRRVGGKIRTGEPVLDSLISLMIAPDFYQRPPIGDVLSQLQSLQSPPFAILNLGE